MEDSTPVTSNKDLSNHENGHEISTNDNCIPQVAALHDQIQTQNRHIMKIDTENRQLHQVIAQLRQVRKITKGDNDNALQERDELKAKTSAQAAEIIRLEKIVQQQSGNVEIINKLRSDLSNAIQRINIFEDILEESKRQTAQLEKYRYDLLAQLEASESDLALMRKELLQRTIEVQNLNEAIQQIQKQSNIQIMNMQHDYQLKEESIRQDMKEELVLLDEKYKVLINEEQQKRIRAEEICQEHDLFRRKAEIDFNKEKKRMQQTLETALTQLNNSQRDVIDRQLIANLIVNYFQRKRSIEVLELISRVLNFTDEEKVIVGLKVAPTNFISSIINSVLAPVPIQPVDVEGDNLAELWINFLLNQSEEENKNKTTFQNQKSISNSNSRDSQNDYNSLK